MDVVKDVVAAILINDHKVLIAQRNTYDPLAGLWEFPGGKIEQGEMPEESLAREMREEFCIEVEVEGFFASNTFPYTKGTIRLLAYKCKWISGIIEASVHKDYKWVTPNELDQFIFAPADRPFVHMLRTNMMNEVL
jgi:8-oxo-dGTP diphosphatase